MKLRNLSLFVSVSPLFALILVASAEANPTDLEASFKISGQVGDISDTAQRGGLPLQVGLKDIRYQGSVTRTLVEQKDDGNVTLWLELRDIQLTVQKTEIAAARRGAECGPMQIALGTQRTLWMAFDAQLLSQQGAADLKLSGVRFELPADNWAIGTPAWVKTWGIGMSESLVVSGLKSELGSKRAEIEGQVRKLAPSIFSQTVAYLKERQ